MALHLEHELLELDLHDPFRIAGDDVPRTRTTTVITSLRDDRIPGLVGIGEGYPDRLYGETAATMLAVFPLLLGAMGEPALSAHGAADASLRMEHAIRGHGAAKCGLDVALHDLIGKATGRPLFELLGVSCQSGPTDFTLGIDLPAVTARRARASAGFEALKVKVGGPSDLASLRAVREVFTGRIRVDANMGWSLEQASVLLENLEELHVEFIEQPFPARAYADLAALQAMTAIPVIADESAVSIEDLEPLVGVVAGVNVKLAKSGGISAANRQVARARALGFRILVGCMEETSIGIAASVLVAGDADWVDLDGNLLLASDPFDGLVLGATKRWQLSERPGLGVTRAGREDRRSVPTEDK